MPLSAAARRARAGTAARKTLVAVILLAGCARTETALPLAAAHDRGARLGTVTIRWEVAGDERAFAGGVRLAVPEVRVRYRVEARNTSGDKIFVRLSDVRLVTSAGTTIATDAAHRACVLAPGAAAAVLLGEIWVPRDRLDAIRQAELSRLAAPLGGRALRAYREWLLQGRPGAAEAVEREIADQAGAPPCG